MDDPSPLLPKFLSVDLWKHSTDSVENDVLDQLCLISAFGKYIHFGSARLKEKPESQQAQLANAVEQFYAESKDSFDGLCSVYVERVLTVSAINEKAGECMVLAGRMCASKLVYPFSIQNKTKDAGFVVDTVRSFEPIFMRLLPLWSIDRIQHLSKTFGVLMHELVALWPAVNPPADGTDESNSSENIEEAVADMMKKAIRCKTILALLFESMALGLYMEGFALLPNSHRGDATCPVIRQLFWIISFFYSQIDPHWDTKKHFIDSDILDIYLGSFDVGLRSYFFDVTVDALDRILLLEVCVVKLSNFAKTLDSGSEQALVYRSLIDMMECGPSLFYPCASNVDKLNIRFYQVDVMVQLGNISMAQCARGDGRMTGMSATTSVREVQLRSAASSRIDAGMNIILMQTGDVDSSARQTLVNDLLMGNDDGDDEGDRDLVDTVAVASSASVAIGEREGGNEAAASAKKKKKKLTATQRAKNAKDRRVDQCSIVLAELCCCVAQEAASEQIRLEDQKCLASEILGMELLDETIFLLVHEQAKTAFADAQETAEVALREVRVKEGLKAQELVLQQLKDGTLSDVFICKILAGLVDGFHRFLQGEWDCTVCLGTIEKMDLETKPLRYLSCCGSFVCTTCLDSLVAQNPTKCSIQSVEVHDRVVELSPAVQAMQLRRKYGSYEVKKDMDDAGSL